jgi:hypothetical protein
VVMALQLFISEYLKEMQEACILLLSRTHAIPIIMLMNIGFYLALSERSYFKNAPSYN